VPGRRPGGAARASVDGVAVELALTDLVADVAATRSVLDALGRPVVLVGHSYGGAVVTAAGGLPLVHEPVHVAAHQLDEGESVNRTRYAELPGTRLGEALPVSGDTVDLDPVIGPRLLDGEAVVHPERSAPWPPVPPGWWSGRAVTAPR